MNYCTNCGVLRPAGNFCGDCGHRHATGPLLVDDDYDEDEDGAEEATSSSSGGGWLAVGLVVLVLLGVFGYGASRHEIDTASPAYAQGQQIAATFIASGAEVVPSVTADEICNVEVAEGATDEVEATSANTTAGCVAELKEHLEAQD